MIHGRALDWLGAFINHAYIGFSSPSQMPQNLRFSLTGNHCSPFLSSALLPEGFRPAPRETEADTSGKTDTLDRKLKDIVYFMVDKQLPTTSMQNADSETLLEAAKRAISENGGSQLEFYCPSNSPVAVHMTKAEEGSSFFGTKTFFVRLQYDDGVIQVKDLEKKQIAWLDRSEIVGLFEGSSNGADAKFYQYLL